MGLGHAAPFTFLSLRYGFGVPCRAAWLAASPARRGASSSTSAWQDCMHAVNLSGSHCAQCLGLSAGITALMLSTQPLLTAVIAHRILGHRIASRRLASRAWRWWCGTRSTRAVSGGNLTAVGTSLCAITCGTLYQRVSAPRPTCAARP